MNKVDSGDHSARDASDCGSAKVAGAPAKKQPYTTPKLKVYGSIKAVTAVISGTGAGDGASKKNTSDPDLKENVVQVGVHPAGFGLYLFDYKPQYRDGCGHGRHFGVMADEVAALIPNAVSRNDDGHLVVDYAKLGITT